MLKKISQIFLISVLVIGCGQESVRVFSVIKPNKKYTNKLTITSTSETNIIANQETLNKIESNGLKLPFITVIESKMRTDIITNSRGVNGDFIATKRYGEMTSSTTLNGKKSVENKPYSGMKILGRYNKQNEFSIDSIVGVKLTPRLRHFHTYALGYFERKIKTPKKNIKIGDTIKNEMPLNIPMQGMGTVNVIINVNYILTEIIRNKAIFNMILDVYLDSSFGKQENKQISGSGTGRCEYDVDENQLTTYISELPMKLTVKIDDEMTAKINLIIKTEQFIEIK